ncbi:MAG: prepilin peptidase [Candidatus Liptonbacteria bacterium]|nr:prepilin peptidase [Candidatus Liptonbacteria bacterium]
MISFFLFLLGAAIGSFIGVIADRYKEDLPIWDRKIIGGRSHCEFCGGKLRWFELVPVVSFIWQKGRCSSCKRRLSLRYLFVEIVSGLLFVFVPATLSQNFYILHSTFYILSTLWLLVFSFLLLVSLIDNRLRIIPNEASAALVIFGALITTFQPFNEFSGSFLGHYAMLFGWYSNPWLNHLLAAAVAGLFFVALIFITKGRGMGGGDMKLAAALGFVFGWPDIIIIAILAFIIGSLFGVAAILLKKERLKSHIAFGPFLAFAGLLVFFFGYGIVNFYFSLFGIV